MIPEIGERGQERLKQARVFIAGAGGLGSPIAIYLAAAGVGTIRLVDRDTVDVTNLNRQILHWDKDTGRRKVESAGEKLAGLNPHVTVETLMQTIYARHGYLPSDLRYGTRFADVIGPRGSDGRMVLDYRKFDDVIPSPLTRQRMGLTPVGNVVPG